MTFVIYIFFYLTIDCVALVVVVFSWKMVWRGWFAFLRGASSRQPGACGVKSARPDRLRPVAGVIVGAAGE